MLPSLYELKNYNLDRKSTDCPIRLNVNENVVSFVGPIITIWYLISNLFVRRMTKSDQNAWEF